MKKKSLLALTFALVVSLLVLGTAFAGGPAEKATGEFEYAPGYRYEFNAHEPMDGRTVKGWANNLAPSGDTYHAHLQCVVVEGQYAWFAAELVEKTVPTWGPWVFVRVYDGGTPGSSGDIIRAQFMNGSNAMAACFAKAVPTGSWPLLDGNLVVHSND